MHFETLVEAPRCPSVNTRSGAQAPAEGLIKEDATDENVGHCYSGHVCCLAPPLATRLGRAGHQAVDQAELAPPRGEAGGKCPSPGGLQQPLP